MEGQEQQEKRQFSVPSRDELIQQIKDLDEDIEHISLNLIKCDFNATEKDIEKTFPDIKFIKVKNYNPGSFEVVFEMRIDAINFIKNHYDKKILARRFFIKMGRQQKELIEKWTGVGTAPRNFRGPNKPFNNRNKQPGNKKPEDQKVELKEGETATEVPKTEVKATETKPEVKTEAKKEIPATQEAPKKEGKIIPKTDNHYKKPEYKKPVHHEAEKKTETHVKKDEPHHPVKKDETHPVKKEETHPVVKKEEHHYVAKKTDVHPVAKKEEVHPAVKKEEHHYVAKKPEVHGAKKEAEKKDTPVAKKDEKKPVEKKVEHHEEKKQEDDGWIVVPTTGKNSKRR